MSIHNNEVNENDGASCEKYTYKSYIIGFVLSLLLTFASFAIVVNKLFSVELLYVGISIFALVQFFVQLVFFLHMTTTPKGRLNLISFLFTVLIVVILVGGSLWIMYNLDYNMMH